MMDPDFVYFLKYSLLKNNLFLIYFYYNKNKNLIKKENAG